jgi:RHS repeat-associated protein
MSARIARIMLLLLAMMLAASAHAQTVEYLHTDALGSVVAVTNASRTVLERREYEPFGSQLTPAVTNGPGYTGHVQDAATGLVYMQQRYYDAQIGRFLSVDPVAATADDFNVYAYVKNDPLNKTDPTGEIGVAGFAIGVVLELTRQGFSGELKDTSLSGIARNVGNAAVAGLAGATGAGLATQIARTAVSVGAKIGLNAIAGAGIGAAAGAASSAVNNGGDVSADDVRSNAAAGLLLGAAGGAVSEGAVAVRTAVNNHKMANLSVADRQMVNHIKETTASTGKAGVNVGGAASAAANVTSNAVANSGGLAIDAARCSGSDAKC